FRSRLVLGKEAREECFGVLARIQACHFQRGNVVLRTQDPPPREVELPTGDTGRLRGEGQEILTVLQAGVELREPNGIATGPRLEVSIVESGDQRDGDHT